MRNLSELPSALLPVLFVTLCVRVGFEAISPVLLPVFALAVITLAVCLWVRLRV